MIPSFGTKTVYISPGAIREYDKFKQTYPKAQKEINAFYTSALEHIKHSQYNADNGCLMKTVDGFRGKAVYFECKGHLPSAPDFSPRIFGVYVPGTNDAIILDVVAKSTQKIPSTYRSTLASMYTNALKTYTNFAKQ